MDQWVNIKGGGRGHRACLQAYNAAIQCGQDAGDCGDPACVFSEAEAPPSADDAIAAALRHHNSKTAAAYAANCGGMPRAAENLFALNPGLTRAGATAAAVESALAALIAQ